MRGSTVRGDGVGADILASDTGHVVDNRIVVERTRHRGGITGRIRVIVVINLVRVVSDHRHRLRRDGHLRVRVCRVVVGVHRHDIHRRAGRGRHIRDGRSCSTPVARGERSGRGHLAVVQRRTHRHIGGGSNRVCTAVIHARVTGGREDKRSGRCPVDNQRAGICRHRERGGHHVADGIRHDRRAADGVLVCAHVRLGHRGVHAAHRVLVTTARGHLKGQMLEAAHALQCAVVGVGRAVGDDINLVRIGGLGRDDQLARRGGAQRVVAAHITDAGADAPRAESTVVVGAHLRAGGRRVGDGEGMAVQDTRCGRVTGVNAVAILHRTRVFKRVVGHCHRELASRHRQRAVALRRGVRIVRGVGQRNRVGVAHRAHVRHRGGSIGRDGQRVIHIGRQRDQEHRVDVHMRTVLRLITDCAVARHCIVGAVGVRSAIIHSLVAAGGHRNHGRVRRDGQRAGQIGGIIVVGNIVGAVLDDRVGGHIRAVADVGAAAREHHTLQCIAVSQARAVHDGVVVRTVLLVRSTVVGPAAARRLNLQRTLVQHQFAVLQTIIVRSTDIGTAVHDRDHGGNIVHPTLGIVRDGTRHGDLQHIRTVIQGHGTAIGHDTQRMDVVADLLGNRHGRCRVNSSVIRTHEVGRHQNQGVGISVIRINGQLTVRHLERRIEVVVIVGELIGGEAHVVIAYQRAPCRGVTRVGEVIHGVMCT